jgi:hypothetical protein
VTVSVRDSTQHVGGLLELHGVKDVHERRALWRQSMAALARVTLAEEAGPLEGMGADALAKGVRAALAANLVDDLEWLEPAAAGAAIYELASAMPPGAEQKELGRRVLARLLEGNAQTFVAIATRMALTTGKGLNTPASKARIALVTELPLAAGVRDERLALALASRRELLREWIQFNSTRSLAARRLAARLLERAAREASKRAAQGDLHALRVFQSEPMRESFDRLLLDRESLVWRHVAVARGLLAPWIGEHRAAIEEALVPHNTPTEWRRGATSIAAFVAVNPEGAMRAASAGLASGVLAKDAGIAAAFLWGLPRAAEAEPEAASDLLEDVFARATPEIAESVLELRAEYGEVPFVERACARALAMMREHGLAQEGRWRDDGAEALAREVMRDLDAEPREDLPVRLQVTKALLAFATGGARAAYAEAKKVLDAAGGVMDTLEEVSRDDSKEHGRSAALARRASIAALRDLDATLLERNVLVDLLHLGAQAETVRQHDQALETLRERVCEWLLARESTPLPASGVAVIVGGKARPAVVTPSHPTLRLRRLRALVHLADGDVEEQEGDTARAARTRKRWLVMAKALLARFEKDPPSPLRRTILAAFARAIDALVRANMCDVSDVLLVVTRNMTDPAELDTLAEASMDPDLIHVLARFADFMRGASTPGMAARTKPHDSQLPPSVPLATAMPNLLSKLGALEVLSRELSPDGSGRTEALRMVIVRLHAAMMQIVNAPSLRAVSAIGGAEDVVASLEASLASLQQLSTGARSRLDPDRASTSPPSLGNARPLSVAVSRVLAGTEASLGEHVLSSCVEELVTGVPAAIAAIATGVVWGIADLPVDRPHAESAAFRVTEAQLPAWVGPRRTIGGFYYVLKPLGGGSVFVVVSVEDKTNPQAQRFALKVPEYSAMAARVLSEADFTRLFREEGSGLHVLPEHANLARFIALDAAAKPKPFMVTEYVEGPTLERAIETRAINVPRVLNLLDDVLAGLEAMHEVGIAHLDVKPRNVILRRDEEAGGIELGVLVDYGLSGRRVRPCCGSAAYGAPEIWTQAAASASPMAVDSYAFACLAYEALTGKVLFGADSEAAQVSLHQAHDGAPPPIKSLLDRPETAPFGELLYGALRRAPHERADVTTLRERVRAIGGSLTTAKWPIPA